MHGTAIGFGPARVEDQPMVVTSPSFARLPMRCRFLPDHFHPGFLPFGIGRWRRAGTEGNEKNAAGEFLAFHGGSPGSIGVRYAFDLTATANVAVVETLSAAGAFAHECVAPPKLCGGRAVKARVFLGSACPAVLIGAMLRLIAGSLAARLLGRQLFAVLEFGRACPHAGQPGFAGGCNVAVRVPRATACDQDKKKHDRAEPAGKTCRLCPDLAQGFRHNTCSRHGWTWHCALPMRRRTTAAPWRSATKLRKRCRGPGWPRRYRMAGPSSRPDSAANQPAI